MHSCPGGPHGGIAAGGVGLHSLCTGGSSCMHSVTAYTCSTPPTVPCEGIQACSGGSGGSETGQGASQTRVGYDYVGRYRCRQLQQCFMRIRFNDVRLPPFGFLYTHARLRLACADLLTRIRIPLQSAGVLSPCRSGAAWPWFDVNYIKLHCYRTT